MEYMDIRLLAAMIVAGNWAMLSLRRAIEAGGLVFQGHQTQRLARSLGFVSSRIVMLPRVFEGPAGETRRTQMLEEERRVLGEVERGNRHRREESGRLERASGVKGEKGERVETTTRTKQQKSETKDARGSANEWAEGGESGEGPTRRHEGEEENNERGREKWERVNTRIWRCLGRRTARARRRGFCTTTTSGMRGCQDSTLPGFQWTVDTLCPIRDGGGAAFTAAGGMVGEGRDRKTASWAPRRKAAPCLYDGNTLKITDRACKQGINRG